MARILEVGTIVADRYKLIERLGGGGMGEVYRAENVLAGRIVAIKLLRSEFAENEDLTRRFFQEAQAANKIRHPNIVDVIDAGFSALGPYVVMECLEGTSLAQALNRLGKLDVPTALAVILPTLSALDAAHRQGIVHRDLKPENIYLAEISGEVRVKLLDFGIAKVQDTAPGGPSPRTSTGVIFGTPDYLSPEQANGDGDVDGRSDIFAVGTVLFELITGRRPFEAPTAVATAYKIVHAPAPTLAAMGYEVAPGVQASLDTALSKEKADRFASAADFADSLAPVVPHGAVRRQVLAALLQTVLAHQPTQAAPKVIGAPAEPTFEPSLPGALPPSWDHVPSPRPKAPPQPVGPTMVSPGYASKPSVESRPVIVREAVPARPAPLATPSRPWPPVAERGGSDPGLSRTPERSEGAVIHGQLSRTPERSEGAVIHGQLSPREMHAQRMTPVASPSNPVPRSFPSSPRVRAGSWTPRPLPASARGRCHVRGTLPRAVGRWLTRAHGDHVRDEVLTVLPTEIAEMARTDSFNALVWYDLESVDTFVEAATLVAQDGDPGSWRALAKENFDRDLGPVFRPAVRTVDAAALLKRMPTVWSRIFDFGAARTDQVSPRKVLVRISGFEPASLSIRNIMVGTFEGMLAPTPGLGIRILTGEASFARDFEIEFVW